MTTRLVLRPDPADVDPTVRSVVSVAIGRSRAYGGPAHHACWDVTSTSPSDVVWLRLPTGYAVYRLARHPRNGRPACDHHGNFLYYPPTRRSRNEVHPLPSSIPIPTHRMRSTA